MSIVVIKNTYPEFPNVPHAEPGDICEWKREPGCFQLIRKADKKTVFVSPRVNAVGLKSNGQPPTLVGVVARVKSKGYVLEVENTGSRDRR
ncbi:MAG: hypothetical protein KAW12_07115 [Candidatus Aminicenantes bacterium]|nr:hypothetical protein [Candidatus Aminicenantes bacterium]